MIAVDNTVRPSIQISTFAFFNSTRICKLILIDIFLKPRCMHLQLASEANERKRRKKKGCKAIHGNVFVECYCTSTQNGVDVICVRWPTVTIAR